MPQILLRVTAKDTPLWSGLLFSARSAWYMLSAEVIPVCRARRPACVSGREGPPVTAGTTTGRTALGGGPEWRDA